MCGDLVRQCEWPLYALDARFTLGWQELHLHPFTPGNDEFFAVVANGVEVARAHLDLRTMPLGPWPGMPEPGLPVVRLQLLEVASGCRGRGIGRATVDQLRFLHPEARLAAVSVQGAAGFWEALGWVRFEHRDRRGRLPLYLAPDSP